MSAVLLENIKFDPLSLETEFPHILRVLLSLVRTLEGYKLLLQNMMHIAEQCKKYNAVLR